MPRCAVGIHDTTVHPNLRTSPSISVAAGPDLFDLAVFESEKVQKIIRSEVVGPIVNNDAFSAFFMVGDRFDDFILTPFL
mgnify:CR=1 FL=1